MQACTDTDCQSPFLHNVTSQRYFMPIWFYLVFYKVKKAQFLLLAPCSSTPSSFFPRNQSISAFFFFLDSNLYYQHNCCLVAHLGEERSGLLSGLICPRRYLQQTNRKWPKETTREDLGKGQLIVKINCLKGWSKTWNFSSDTSTRTVISPSNSSLTQLVFNKNFVHKNNFFLSNLLWFHTR